MPTQEQIKSDALVFLRENITAVVATTFNNEPRASTVYYYVDDAFNFYFVTKRNTSKYMNINLNPRAAIVVGTGPDHISIQGHGKVELIFEDEMRGNILDKFSKLRATEHIKNWPIEDVYNFKDRDKVVFKINTEGLLYMNLDSVLHADFITDEYMKIV
jgi:uncharacterized pyridoxamine 5'-phosphate oxidase family protein